MTSLYRHLSVVSTGNCKLGHDCRRVCSHRRRDSFVASASAVCIVSTCIDLWSWFLHHMVVPWLQFLEISRHLIIRRGSQSHRARALNEGGVGTNCRFSTFKPPYRRNGARYNKGYDWSLIGNRIRAFDWYQNHWPWLTLKWPWTAVMHSVALHTFSEPTTKTDDLEWHWMAILR